MKVLMINSSPRKNGATAKILGEISDILKEYDEVGAELIHLSDYSLEFF
ncbi:MAG: NAD(P)H-dependent oxidoreductase [Clostridiales bacterium]|nr:NAD(P)H-dependent oxidoreductase [Clostridiales bacterium]